MSMKSFDEYFKGYKNYDGGGDLDKTILADAKKVVDTLKTPEAIEQFREADYETQQKMVKGLDDGHSGFSFSCVCSVAYQYALYKATEAPYTFDEYFAGYKNYDNGGKLDQRIVADAKKVYETLKIPEAIDAFYKASLKKQRQMVKGLDDGHSGYSFNCVCRNAYVYADYAQKYIKEDTQTMITEPESERISKQDLVSALDKVSYDKSVVLKMIDKHPDMLKILIDAKDKEGKPLLDALAIDDVLFNCKDTIEKHPGRMVAILNDPDEIESISSWKNRGAGVWRAVGDPFQSTIDKNPEVFGKKEKITKNRSDSNELTHLRRLVKSRKMTKEIQQGMDKSTPIKKVDAGAPFNVVAKKKGKGSR